MTRKRKLLLATAVAAVVVIGVLFFPTRRVHAISGNADILRADKEKQGTCQLSVELTELFSLVMHYRSSFTFTLEGREYTDFGTNHYDSAGDLRAIDQMFYDEELNAINLCQLVYEEGDSYYALLLDDRIYFLANGSQMDYSQIPVMMGSD